MADREDVYLHHQQQRWLRPDADRWIRSDAARFVKPGTDPADAYPALAVRKRQQQARDEARVAAALEADRALQRELASVKAQIIRRREAREREEKYSPSQPRIPAGSGRESGRWTDGSGGGLIGNPLTQPMGAIDIGDAGAESGSLGLFGITPQDTAVDGVQLAGDPPIGDSGGRELENPPDIPKVRPTESSERTAVQRSIGSWIGRAMNLGVAVDAYMGIVNNVEWLTQYQAAIETYRDPPKTLDELQQAVDEPRAGTEVHHVMERTALEYFGLGRSEINAPENKVRIPILKHYDITGWYSQPNSDFGGLTPRQYLADKSLEERMRVGLDALAKFGVLRR